MALFAFLTFSAACRASAPSESSFTPPVVAPEMLATQELASRRMADVYLGLHVSSSFMMYAQTEHQKGQRTITTMQAQKKALAVDSRVLEEDSDNEVSLEEQPELEESDSDDVSFLQEDASEGKDLKLENISSFHKTSALKALHLQLYLTASDVHRTYWAAKVLAIALPPQLSLMRVYKSYLNTVALSTAFQFHDAFTQEAYLDDFNDRWGTFTGVSSDYSEALSEQQTFSLWSTLATIKYQLLFLSLYEKAIYSQLAAATPATQAVSLLELSAEPVSFAAAPALASVYPYLQYYGLYLRFSAVSAEMQVAQTGLYVASMKVMWVGKVRGSVNVPNEQEAFNQALLVETSTLPMLLFQWASMNQQKYYLDLYSMMLETQVPPLAAAVSADRADNSFVNLEQTDTAVATPDLVSNAKSQ